MNKLLLITAALCAFAAPAYAGPLITVTGYNEPDFPLGFRTVTTYATGASDTPYNDYTGPVDFTLSDNSHLTVYSVDLNHFLQTTSNHFLQTNVIYELTPLTTNGEGQLISEFDSNRIGHIALLGAAALAAGDQADLALAVAAQAAIWNISYTSDSPEFVSPNALIKNYTHMLLGDVFPDLGYALALRPYGQGWSESPYASQEMVVGFASAGFTSGVPEPSTWAMMLLGFVGLGFAGRKRIIGSRLSV